MRQTFFHDLTRRGGCKELIHTQSWPPHTQSGQRDRGNSGWCFLASLSEFPGRWTVQPVLLEFQLAVPESQAAPACAGHHCSGGDGCARGKMTPKDPHGKTQEPGTAGGLTMARESGDPAPEALSQLFSSLHLCPSSPVPQDSRRRRFLMSQVSWLGRDSGQGSRALMSWVSLSSLPGEPSSECPRQRDSRVRRPSSTCAGGTGCCFGPRVQLNFFAEEREFLGRQPQQPRKRGAPGRVDPCSSSTLHSPDEMCIRRYKPVEKPCIPGPILVLACALPGSVHCRRIPHCHQGQRAVWDRCGGAALPVPRWDLCLSARQHPAHPLLPVCGDLCSSLGTLPAQRYRPLSFI
nr:PREDICTED: uncharacterized protein LOC107079601 [Lepisosteus oculatus]